jgi:circadian clock protein KaiC
LVDEGSMKFVIIDSIIGYFTAMGAADLLLSQLHELMTYLTRRGALLLICGAQEGFMSIGRQEAVDVSYLSDTIFALTFFEADGAIRRAITAVKKKHGPHRNSIHELTIVEGKIDVHDAPLKHHEPTFVAAGERMGNAAYNRS